MLPARAQPEDLPSLPLHEPAIYAIVHPDVPQDILTHEDLRSILLGKRRFWSTNVPIQLIINGRADSDARKVWLEDITNMSEIQYTQYWVGMVFRGRALNAPHVVSDANTMMALVATLPGAISLVSVLPNEYVRVLQVTNTSATKSP